MSDCALLNIVPAVLSVATAAVVALIAWKQYRTAIIANRMSVFQRRLKVYEAVETVLNGYLTDAEFTRETLVKFLRESEGAKFLFGDDVNEFLIRLYKEAIKLQGSIDSTRALGGPNVDTSRQKKALVDWIFSQRNEAASLFRPYLEYPEK